MTKAPGTDESSFLAFTLLDDLLHMLRKKGVLATDDVTSLLESTADRLGKDPRFFAKRSVDLIRDSMIPEHKGR